MSNDTKDFPTYPELVGKKIWIKAAVAEDIGMTFHWYLHSNPALLSPEPPRFQTASDAAEAYKKSESRQDAQQFMILLKNKREIVGWVKYQKLNRLNRSAEIEFLTDPDERHKGYMREALYVLAGFLFNSQDLNKIYCQICSDNKDAIKLLEKGGFKNDGSLRRHYFFKNEFHDGLIYSMLRSEYEQ